MSKTIKTQSTQYLARRKKTKEYFSFYWSPQDQLYVNGVIVDKSFYEIVEVQISEYNEG